MSFPCASTASASRRLHPHAVLWWPLPHRAPRRPCKIIPCASAAVHAARPPCQRASPVAVHTPLTGGRAPSSAGPHSPPPRPVLPSLVAVPLPPLSRAPRPMAHAPSTAVAPPSPRPVLPPPALEAACPTAAMCPGGPCCIFFYAYSGKAGFCPCWCPRGRGGAG